MERTIFYIDGNYPGVTYEVLASEECAWKRAMDDEGCCMYRTSHVAENQLARVRYDVDKMWWRTTYVALERCTSAAVGCLGGGVWSLRD